MLFSFRLSVCLLAVCSSAFAAVLNSNVEVETTASSKVERRSLLGSGLVESLGGLISSLVPSLGCIFSATSRDCWSAGFNILTDFDAKFPTTGKTVTYDLEITNVTMSPDGTPRNVFAINGQYPGPTLIANWGDTMVVNVKNSLEHNGTGIHFHGLRQLNSNGQDGTNGVTECPIAPGGSKTYKFHCTQFGSSWYHSHFSVQYADGVVGGILINGPATQNYDYDLGTLTLTDWYHTPAFDLDYVSSRGTSGAPIADNGLINGTMKSPDGSSGAYFHTTVEKGKKYRLRVINTGVNDFYHFSIDSHNLTVITADFIPVEPFNTNYISLGVGQRYDVIIHANQEIENYWMRSDPTCSSNANSGNIKGILSYNFASGSEEPSSSRHDDIPTACSDMDVTPTVANDVPSSSFSSAVETLSQDVAIINQNGPLVQWLINGSAMDVDWNYPTLQYIMDGNTSYPTDLNVVELPNANEWYYFVIQSVQGRQVELPHPIHLHGHDFYILGSGTGTWSGDVSSLKFTNPPRRDTAMLPASGYLIIAFPADNPGAWLMHCHIPWHVGQGFSMQFLERKNEIKRVLGDTQAYEETCAAWKSYWEGDHVYVKDDSGI
ncbi:multicopper oxidase [Saccharata proteae CBS 121410]|uniref:laccase n=1 Tax=Saccharata proteae CBS 121410 TaxID=1314787 RepID=A0A9P4I0C9_9PEZI|nr:multicopper oxidase [Saccharata proteae CBS 121410]